MLEIFDCEQGTPEWFECRLGIPTASMFHAIMAKGEGKTRRTYLYKLAGERLTGEPADSYTNAHMERGRVMEDEARRMYEFMKETATQQVGFIRNGEAGASPDSLIGDSGMLEIKTKLPHLHIEALENGGLPSIHKAQVQGQLWIAEREWCDFVSYWPKLPPLIVTVARDEEYIQSLSEAVDLFCNELNELERRLR